MPPLRKGFSREVAMCAALTKRMDSRAAQITGINQALRESIRDASDKLMRLLMAVDHNETREYVGEK